MTFLSTSQHFSLDNFEGPLDLLLHLVLKSEIDIFEVSIQELIEQLLKLCEEWKEAALESGADALSTAATLLWIKSRTLLPQREQENGEEEELDPRFDLIHQLIDYCRFKEMGKYLNEKSERTQYFRGGDFSASDPTSKPLGTDHLGIEDLTEHFRLSLKNAEARFGEAIEEEVFRVSDKMRSIRKTLKSEPILYISHLFSAERSKTELLVTFLAILELMKLSELELNRDTEGQLIVRSQKDSN